MPCVQQQIIIQQSYSKVLIVQLTEIVDPIINIGGWTSKLIQKQIVG